MSSLGTWEDAVQWLRGQPSQERLVLAAFYDDPLIQSATRYADSSEWRAVRALLPDPPGKALDVGAGRGISAFALARDGWDVTALEPDASAIVGAGAIRALSEESGLPISIVETWGEQLPFDDASFDVVHCRQVLHHARDLEALSRECARVLRPGGVFIATREHVISRDSDLQAFLDSHPLHNRYGGEHAYRQGRYRSALMGAGFSDLRSLNPYASDINLYPTTQDELRHRISARLRWPWPGMIPDFALALLGRRLDQPGRLYTFLCRKPIVA